MISCSHVVLIITSSALQKLEIHSLIESISLPHTYIDVGWWMQLYIPVPPSPDLPPQFLAMTNSLYGTGEQKSLVTDRSHIGAWSRASSQTPARSIRR